ncbi:MAG: hypothetical protein QM802_05610 [Agriterribacter sp.]
MEDFLQDLEQPKTIKSKAVRIISMLTMFLLLTILSIEFYYFASFGMSVREMLDPSFFMLIGVNILLGIIVYLLEKRHKIGWTLQSIVCCLLLGLSFNLLAYYWKKDTLFINWIGTCTIGYMVITNVTQLILLYLPKTRIQFRLNFNFFAATGAICFVILLLAFMIIQLPE